MGDDASTAGEEIRVSGIVQGVGFRPAVWRLARACGLSGDVSNDGGGVLIRLWGGARERQVFVDRLQADPPPLARIDAIERLACSTPAPADGFAIAASRSTAVRTDMAADAATCPDCIAETLDPASRRYRYPFTNCTNCGPRLSIIRRLPYDRPSTSMAPFVMCPDCAAEYEHPSDRRFHAQPIACPVCGPAVSLMPLGGSADMPGGDVLDATARLIDAGAIVAIKGIGGYHLACDAANAAAVDRLRRRKRRFGKPFALMARDLDVVRGYCAVDDEVAAAMAGRSAPIVVLDATGPRGLPDGISPGLGTLGFMLPYTPLHHLLMRPFVRPIVMTSGNATHRPQCIDDAVARAELAGIADWVLGHDRAIVNRVDDSVVRVMAGEARMLRRGRGYAPMPIGLPPGFADAPAILALGGELKNTFCLVRDGKAILSQHQGDLEDADTEDDYRRNLALFETVLEQAPEVVAIDPHPDYLSAKDGRRRAAETGAAIVEVQHHHAHVASCLAENGVPLDAAPVLGIALDGLGYGDDGTIWGGEFLLADYRAYRRLATFRPVAMIGGAQAIREPWRNAYAHIVASIGWDRFAETWGDLELFRFLQSKPLATLQAMLRQGINCPPASSCGRLFDAVAAAIGICAEETLYEGQAAAELEAVAGGRKAAKGYVFDIRRPTPQSPAQIEPGPMWQALLNDIAAGLPQPTLSARFHAGLARAVVDMADGLRSRPDGGGFEKVALSGGVFQNKVLLEHVVAGLAGRGFDVLTQSVVPANDGGLSLGQAAVAAARHLPQDGIGADVPGHTRTNR